MTTQPTPPRVQPLVVAHRGASLHHPEHTSAAFLGAVTAAADVIECDVRSTMDGVYVLMHDPIIDRTTTATGQLDTMTWDQLREIDAGSWHPHGSPNSRVLSLEEACQQLDGQMDLDLELKGGSGTPSAWVEGLVSTLTRVVLPQQLWISSFDNQLLRAAYQQIPAQWGAKFALVTNRFSWGALWNARRWQLDALHVNRRICSRQLIHWAHRWRLNLWSYTVDDLEEAQRFASWGIDGLITNGPAELIQAIKTEKPYG